jgi:hypothetical protein
VTGLVTLEVVLDPERPNIDNILLSRSRVPHRDPDEDVPVGGAIPVVDRLREEDLDELPEAATFFGGGDIMM